MDKSCQSSAADSNITNTTSSGSSSSSSRDHYLRHLNKLSQKISKPIIKKPTFETPPPPPLQNNQNLFNNQLQPQAQAQAQPQQNLQHQPPVYNINKNDFRDVVQKLTGSPAHDRIVTPPPIQQPKPQSSRLQRIRPPPLPHITNRPPPLLNPSNIIPPPQQLQIQPPPSNFNFNAVNFNHNFSGFGIPRQQTPLSPLPPFPTVHAAAESPISAYMRDLHNLVSNTDSKNFSAFSPLPLSISPRPQPPPEQPQQQPQQQQQEQQEQPPAPAVVRSQSMFQMPTSPNPFGCLNSQLSSYPLLSPGLLFSPNSGQLGFPQLPLSPTVPAPSPRWREL